MNRAFTNARIIDPAQGLDEVGTLLVVDGKIAAIGKKVDIPANMERQDCGGKAILPGLIDMQVFTGEPGEEHRETLATASQAAAVDSRSSHKSTGRAGKSGRLARLRKKACVACTRGPAEPSILSGSPITSPPIFSAAIIAAKAAASGPNFLRLMVSKGVAILCPLSPSASPMVLLPRSSPISLWPGASAVINSVGEDIICIRFA